MTITLIIFLVMGFTIDSSMTDASMNEILASIDGAFNINGWLFLVPVLVIVLIVKKVPALPALIGGTLLGGVFAIIFQPQAIDYVSGISGDGIRSAFVAVWKSMYGEISIQTDNAMVNELLSTGGMAGMLNTIWLILCAMIFGGVMEACGMLQKIASFIVSKAKSTGSLIASTTFTCAFFNATASDQYLAIVVPGRMFRIAFKDRGLKPEVLSRTLEDSGTVTSVLVPWNTCGATQASILGVSTFVYAPYCFFNIISPFMTMLFGYLNIKIRRYRPEEVKPED
jgi:NhaC family Na+:H+ antiporter